MFQVIDAYRGVPADSLSLSKFNHIMNETSPSSLNSLFGTSIKSRIRRFLNCRFVKVFLLLFIVLNIFCVGLETDKSVYAKYSSILQKIETYSVILFTVEYLLRFISMDKIRNVVKPLMMMDLLAILPYYLAFFTVDLRFLRILRLLRIMGVFKLSRHFGALQLIGGIFYRRRTELLCLFGVLLLLIFISSFFIFYAESAAQPDVFHNILDAFWWTVVTITTVGYGDVCPVTAVGKLLSAFIILVGIMLFALPTSILTADFLNEFRKNNTKQ